MEQKDYMQELSYQADLEALRTKYKDAKQKIGEKFASFVNPDISLNVLIVNDLVVTCSIYVDYAQWGIIKLVDSELLIYLLLNNVKILIDDMKKNSDRSSADILYEYLSVKDMSKEAFAKLLEQSKDKFTKSIINGQVNIESVYPRVTFNDL